MSCHRVGLLGGRWMTTVTVLGVVCCLANPVCIVHGKELHDCRGIQFPMSSAYRYPDLFKSESYIESMVHTREIDEYFIMGKIKSRYPFPGVCKNVWPMPPYRRYPFHIGAQHAEETLGIPHCTLSEPSTQTETSKQTPLCCKTEMSVTIPSSVVSVYSGQTHIVKHMANSYQFLHEGTCAPGSSCHGGRCRLSHRLQWILVEKNGKDAFVPVSVGNHCYCRY